MNYQLAATSGPFGRRLKNLFLLTFGVVIAAFVLTACNDDSEAAVPTPDPVPATRATAAPAATVTPALASIEAAQPIAPEPTEAPEPALTPGPVSDETESPSPAPPRQFDATAGVVAYVDGCGEALAGVFASNSELGAELDESEDLTWGQFAKMNDLVVSAFSQIMPPSELEDFHEANLNVLIAFRDLALTHPADSSFAEDFATLLSESIFPATLEIGFNPDLSPEEQARQMEATAEKAFSDFFGPDFLAAAKALDEARTGLDEQTLQALDESACGFGPAGAADEFGPVAADEGQTPGAGAS